MQQDTAALLGQADHTPLWLEGSTGLECVGEPSFFLEHFFRLKLRLADAL